MRVTERGLAVIWSGGIDVIESGEGKGALLAEEEGCHASMPNVGVIEELLESFRWPLLQLGHRRGTGFSVGDPENASAVSMHSGVFVTFSGVGPVEDIEGAFGAGGEFDAAEERVLAQEKVGSMACLVARAVTVKRLAIAPTAVEVEGEDLVLVFFGEIVPLINDHADVRVASAEVVGGSMT